MAKPAESERAKLIWAADLWDHHANAHANEHFATTCRNTAKVLRMKAEDGIDRCSRCLHPHASSAPCKS